MKKLLALTLAVFTVCAVLASCAAPGAEPSGNIRVTSSDAADAATWLEERLGEKLTDRIVLGTDATGYGVDLSALEDDGYIIRDLGGEVALFARTTGGLDRAVRRYAKSAERDEALTDETYHEGCRVKRIEIAGRDISEYTLFAADEPYILAAANELSSLIERACGVSLAVSTGEPSSPYIALRYVHDEALSTCGYRWSVDDGGLTLECSDGYKPSSPHMAVVRFLENAFGWLGLSFGNEALPEADLVSLPVGESGGEVNAFECLAPYGDSHCPSDLFEHSYANLSPIPMACHGMQSNGFGGALSTSPEHDWYADQPCWLSEDFFEESYADILAYVERIVTSGYTIGENFFFVDIAHGDNDNWCGCKKCLKLFQSEGGSHSAHIVTWANALIEEINKDYPGLYYGVFAYQGTNKPPKSVVPCDQLYITYCYDKCCSAHSLDGKDCTEDPLCNIGITWWEPRDNKTMSGDLLGWLDLTKNVYVWYYGLQNGYSTMSFVHTVRDDVRFLYENGVKGVFWESEDTGFSTGKVSKWLLYGLGWNIDMTDEQYKAYYDRILCALYGEDAAPWVREYITLQERVYRTGRCMTCWSYYGIGSHICDTLYLEVADELFDLIERARALAGSKKEEERLTKLSCECVYKTCSNGYFPALNAGDDERVAELCRRYALMIERTKALGIDVAAREYLFVSWASPRIGYETDLELEAWTKKDITYSDFSVTKPTVPMPERAAAILAERGN